MALDSGHNQVQTVSLANLQAAENELQDLQSEMDSVSRQIQLLGMTIQGLLSTVPFLDPQKLPTEEVLTLAA
jgi:prefoldin subunit 5